jgi:DNA-binding helix-hairpin-helix protein with protein kinase domain
MPPPPEVVDASGREIRLDKLLGQGGEGAVYGIVATNHFVAKIYHAPLKADRATKIQMMAAHSDEAVKQLTAWPIGLIFTKAGRAPIGLLLPKVENSKDVHKLYSPKSRLAEFQKANWRFLVIACANIARSFKAVHSTGSVIGDINEGSVLVADNARVKLIDCESFQWAANGRRFACEVGVETFTPPELQGKNFREVVRTINHDSFGLAVMIFLLLFMGRHPFAGRFLGRGDMPIPKAISEFRFAYSAMRADVQMDKPPGTPPLSIVGDEVAFMFEKAFAKQMAQGGRPDPTEWVTALENLEKLLKQCTVNPSHWHYRGVSCPWCPMEASTGVELFPFVGKGTAIPLQDLTALWRQIEGLRSPGPAPEIQPPSPQPSAEAIALSGSYRRANMLAFAVALLIGAIAVFGQLKAPAPFLLLFGALLSFFGARKWFDKSSDIYKFRDAAARAENVWNQANSQWLERAGSKAFDDKKQQILGIRQAVDYLPTLRTKKLNDLRKSLRHAQLVRYLDSFEIDRARLDGIGEGRKRTLQSYGIETAADLLNSRVESVPGFGPKLCGTLYSWRHSLEGQFTFNPATGVDQRDINKIEQEIAAERRKLEEAVRAEFSELSNIHARILNVRNQLRSPIENTFREYLQARANYRTASGG